MTGLPWRSTPEPTSARHSPPAPLRTQSAEGEWIIHYDAPADREGRTEAAFLRQAGANFAPQTTLVAGGGFDLYIPHALALAIVPASLAADRFQKPTGADRHP
jgi:hypothetical protein